MIPNLLYKKGRRKALEKFLSKKKIFKTEFNYYKYERQAKENIKAELELL